MFLTISVLAFVGALLSIAEKPKDPVKLAEPIEATIVGVFQDSSGLWWSTLSWGDANRGTWGNKLGKEGDRVKIYAGINGKYSIEP